MSKAKVVVAWAVPPVVKHDPDPARAANLQQLCDRMKRAKAALGVCFDGDADRCVFVDNRGQVVPPDLTAALVARHLLASAPGSTVVYDLRCSRVMPEEIRKAGGVPRRERTNLPFLKKVLNDTKGVFAAQAHGRCCFRDNSYCESGLITLAHLLNILTRSGRPLDELIAPLKRYAHTGERRFRTEGKGDVVTRIAERYGAANIDYLDGITVSFDEWWFNVRPGRGEQAVLLNLEAADDAMLEAKLAELTPLLGVEESDA